MFPLTNKSQRMGRKHAGYQNWASRWNRPKLCGLFPQRFAPDSDARCLEQVDGSVRKLQKRGEGGSRLLIRTVARPVDGPLVLATQMLTSHCHLFVFGQGSGYWSTCPGESICFTEAILLDLRIVWSCGVQGERCQEGILWGMVCPLLRIQGNLGVNVQGHAWSGSW